jgi:hypothetical protein
VRVIRAELVKLFTRPRTWVAFGLLCGLPVVVAAFLATTHLAPPPGQGAAFLSAVLADGSLYPAAAMAMVVPIFLPVAVSVWPATRSPARPPAARCATCWPGRWAGPGCWWRSWSR